MPHSPSYRRILHRMGYYNYQLGYMNRNLDPHSGWESHLERCRSFILKAVEMINPVKITILGSGWLIELPLADMAGKTDKICLVDIIHPPEVIKQTSDLKNVEISEQDVSGGLIEEVWNRAGRRTFLNRLSSLETIRIPEFEFDEDPGLVISLNLLTQLETLPEKLLRRKSKATEDQLMIFKRDIQEKHLQLLKKYPSVLISDAAEIFADKKNNKIENKTILVDLPDGKLSDEWIWDFDLTHVDYYRKNSLFRVIARIL